jgi:hypothetical protein
VAAAAGAPEDLALRLREAGLEEVLLLLRTWADVIPAGTVRQALRNPFADGQVIDEVASRPHLLAAYEVRRDLTFHRSTPEVLALRFVSGLTWRDLVELGVEVRVRPPVRHAADRYLIERLPALAEGERVSIARRASLGVLGRLRHDPSRRVISALLENPRLTEGVLAPLVHHESALPPVLALVAGNPRWGARYGIRVGLAQNPQTPVATVLAILPHLKKADLRAVAAADRLAAPVRRRARLLVEGE